MLFIVFFPQARYKEKYESQVKGHYIGSFEDISTIRCRQLEVMKNEVSSHNVHICIFSYSWSQKMICVSTFVYFLI